MANVTHSDLRDPSPPVPGARERAAVAARAHQLGRRRRIVQGAGALGMVAAVAVGVAALTAGGTSSGPEGRRVEAASSATGSPSLFTVSGTVSHVPAGVVLTLTLTGDGDTFRDVADANGHYSIGNVPPGEYQASYSWEATDDTAANVAKIVGPVSITRDFEMDFAIP
jgi:hypothetical protein